MIRVALILAATLFAALPARAAVEIEQVESPGGIKAWLVQEDELPADAAAPPGIAPATSPQCIQLVEITVMTPRIRSTSPKRTTISSTWSKFQK